MKKIRTYFILFLSCFLFSAKAYPQIAKRSKNFNTVVGQYKSANDLQFFINIDSSFYILKGHSKAFDAALPNCDTISKGTWHLFSKTALRLANDKSYQSILFNISEESRMSEDSIYIKIDLPKDATFSVGRFKYQITMIEEADLLDSSNPIIILPKKKLLENGNVYYHLGLTIQDVSPLNCNLTGRCYQRIFFNVFENHKLNAKSNYFTIKLINFNDCYVERADVDNQLVFASKNKIHWQDVNFVRVR